MSRVLVTGINYAPESIGTGKYTAELCEWLVMRGHAVRVITAPPYYPSWRVWPEYRTLWFRRESRAGVDVIRCPIWVPEQPRGLTRMLHLLSFALTSLVALAYSLAWRPQLVINVAPTLAGAPGAWLLARITRAKCWLHLQDFEVDVAMDMGFVGARPLRRIALAAERCLLGRFDVVSTISTRMLARLRDKGVAASRSMLVANWVDLNKIQPLDTPSPYRAELNIPADAIVALYSGNMGLKQGLELLKESAHQLADDPNLYLVFGGEGPARAMLEEACTGLPNVRFLGLQPSERLHDWLGLADIHLLPQRADVADLVMPSKLTGMLASGRAVLATALAGTAVAEAIQDCGIATPPGDTAPFVHALRQLACNVAQRREFGRAARQQAVTTLGRDAILERFEHRVAQLLGMPTQLPDFTPAPANDQQDPR